MKEWRPDPREPEQVKAFRDTWKDGIHSYLTYLRDRLTVARDLLAESGSIFIQIGDKNVHRVRTLMDEVFGEENFVSQIAVQKTGGFSQSKIGNILDHIIWYGKNTKFTKYRPLVQKVSQPPTGEPNYVLLEFGNYSFRRMTPEERKREVSLPNDSRIFRFGPLQSDGTSNTPQELVFEGRSFLSARRAHWKTNLEGMERLSKAGKLVRTGKSIAHRLYWDYSAGKKVDNIWTDTQSGGFNDPTIYVVLTTTKVVQRCILMATDPGDIVLDPTCGSGTTSHMAEQWGRKWITIDTSRVALALARKRLMSAKYPYYLLADTDIGRKKEFELSGENPNAGVSLNDLSQGFVYERAQRVMLSTISRNSEIDVIWDSYEAKLEPLRRNLTEMLPSDWLGVFREEQKYDVQIPNKIQEWEVPHEFPKTWPAEAKEDHTKFWELRIARQEAINKSIAQKADVELLYDRPYEDKTKVRVAGPFTVESLSPHRVVPMDDRDDVLDDAEVSSVSRSSIAPETDFAQVILDYLRKNGVQQGKKEDKLTFTHLFPWPGEMIAAEAHFNEGDTPRRAGILLGPEYGSLTRNDITAAAREATEARFDVLIACGFAFDAHSTGLNKLGPLPIIKAKMNPDLHMASDLKDTGKGNMFMVIGEPDINIDEMANGDLQVKLHGMDVFVPATGEIRSGEKDDIAAWFIDTNYNEESFFVRHAYFLGAGDPYKSLKTSLKAEINKEAWETLYRDTSRPFPRPSTGRIAVKVINHFGDEVMKVFTV